MNAGASSQQIRESVSLSGVRGTWPWKSGWPSCASPPREVSVELDSHHLRLDGPADALDPCDGGLLHNETLDFCPSS